MLPYATTVTFPKPYDAVLAVETAAPFPVGVEAVVQAAAAVAIAVKVTVIS